METARGRWFLAEYDRRARAAVTGRLYEALERIDARLDALGAPPPPQAAPIIERLTDIVWKLRESGVEDYVCAKIEAVARDLASGAVQVEAKAQAGDAQANCASATPADDAAADALPPCDGGELEKAQSVVSLEPDMLWPPASGETVATPIAQDDAAPQIIAPMIAPMFVVAEEAIPLKEEMALQTHADEIADKGAPATDPRTDALLWLDRLPLLDRMALFA